MLNNNLSKFIKKAITLIVSFLVTLYPFVVDTPDNREIAKIKKAPLALSDNFTITAHAGAMNLPDNSRLALTAAVRAGFDVVEMDISYRPDGTPVIIHHPTPKQWQGMLVDDAFAIVASGATTQINLDNKSLANLPELYRLILKHGLEERVFFTGVEDESSLELIHNHCPIPYYLNCSTDEALRDNRQYAQQLADRIIAGGFVGINCSFNDVSRAIVEVMHENDLLVSVWTVDKNIDMYRMLAISPDNITTRKPHRLKRAIDSWE